MNTSTKSVLVLATFVAGCFSVAAAGGVTTAGSVGIWYPTLSKPTWTPPSWVFGPVWTALYLMMAVAAWLVWRKVGWRGGKWPLGLFAVQLALNAAWAPLFFGLHRIDLALADIVLLWAAIVATLVSFWRVTPVAGVLLLPYVLWVSFAAALNFAIWELNHYLPFVSYSESRYAVLCLPVRCAQIAADKATSSYSRNP